MDEAVPIESTCSFCGLPKSKTRDKMLFGPVDKGPHVDPTALICSECVEVSKDILDEPPKLMRAKSIPKPTLPVSRRKILHIVSDD